MSRLVPLAVVVVGVYLAWSYFYPTNSFRYRLTLVVSVDGKPATGTGVIEVTESRQPRLGSAPSGLMSIRGEAVVVDLGARGLLFALLKGRDYHSQAGEIAYSTFPPPGGGGAAMPANLRRYQTQHLRAELAPHQLPLLVRFRDIDDPKTVERVEPGDLAASFGPGVYLERAILEITRDAVTTGIEKKLAWLPGRRGRRGYLHGAEPSRARAVPNLNGSEFSTEIFP